MKLKKAVTVIMAAVMSVCVFTAPASERQAEAKTIDRSQNANDAEVYAISKTGDIPNVSFHTPDRSVKMYAGLSWEQLDMNLGVRMYVRKDNCGEEAKALLNKKVSSMGAELIGIYDMDMERVLSHGWSEEVGSLLRPVRICMTLPKDCDQSKDYALVSVKAGNTTAVLGDLDAEPSTITVETDYCGAFALVAGKPGAFDAYKAVSPYATEEVWVPYYTKSKYLESRIKAQSDDKSKYTVGILTDAETVKSVIGDGAPKIKISQDSPGEIAKGVMQNEVNKYGISGLFHEIYLTKENGERVTQTNQKLLVTLSVPYNYPAYADYAVVVLNADGSASVLPDLDGDYSTVTIETDNFRAYGVIWGGKGAFDSLRQ